MKNKPHYIVEYLVDNELKTINVNPWFFKILYNRVYNIFGLFCVKNYMRNELTYSHFLDCPILVKIESNNTNLELINRNIVGEHLYKKQKYSSGIPKIVINKIILCTHYCEKEADNESN